MSSVKIRKIIRETSFISDVLNLLSFFNLPTKTLVSRSYIPEPQRLTLIVSCYITYNILK